MVYPSVVFVYQCQCHHNSVYLYQEEIRVLRNTLFCIDDDTSHGYALMRVNPKKVTNTAKEREVMLLIRNN